MSSIELLRLWVVVLGVMLAISYIKTLSHSVTDREIKNIGEEYVDLTKIVPLKVLFILIWVVQGVRLALSLGFILGATTLINTVWMIVPLLLLVTDSARVLQITFGLYKNVRDGTLAKLADKLEKPKLGKYVVNLILVAVTIGMLY